MDSFDPEIIIGSCKSMDLYIVRHGETDWNVARKLQGQSDILLNKNGIEKARITADALKNLELTHIFSSPLKRAYKTAEILRGKRAIEIVTDDRIKEISFGVDEGVEESVRRPEFMNFFADPIHYEPAEGGESYEQLWERAKEFIYQVLVPLSEEQADAKVMVVAHGALNRALMITLKHQGIAQMWEGVFQKNLSVNHFTVQGNQFQSIEEGKVYYD